MSIKVKMQDEVKTAMKAGEKQKVTSLRSLLAAIKQVEIDTRQELPDDQISAILQKEIKKRREALEFAEKAGRDELIQENKAEIALIQSYLGEQLSEADLRKIILAYQEAGLDNLGKVMGQLNKEHKGKFEGKIASQIAKELVG